MRWCQSSGFVSSVLSERSRKQNGQENFFWNALTCASEGEVVPKAETASQSASVVDGSRLALDGAADEELAPVRRAEPVGRPSVGGAAAPAGTMGWMVAPF